MPLETLPPQAATPPSPQAPSAPPSPDPIVDSPGTVEDLDRQLHDSLKNVFDRANDRPETKPEVKEPHETTKEKGEEKPNIDVHKADHPSKETAVDPSTIADPKNLGKSADGWKALKKISSTNFEIANQRAQENETLKKTFAQKELEYKKQIEDREKQISELSGYRAQVDIQADPEFISKFEQPIDKLATELKGMLKSKNVSDDIIKQIDFTDSMAMANILDALDKNTDKIFSKRFGRRVEDLLELNDRKKEQLDAWKTNHKELIETKRKETFGKQAQTEGQMLAAIDQFASEKDDKGRPKIAFLNKMEVPQGSNKDQVKAIESHNQVVDAMQGKLKQLIKAEAPQDRVEIAIAALGAQWLKWQLDNVTKRLNAKEEELKRISNAGSEGEGKVATPKQQERRPTGSDPTTLDLDTAFETAFPGRR